MRSFARRFLAGLRPILLLKNRLLCLLTIALALCLPAACSDDYETITNIDSTRTSIVFFGDSITAGYDVSPDQAFPALISEELMMPVVNAGLPGDTTASALARLERDVLIHNPRLVVVELGGNDFRRRISNEETFDNLERIVARIVEQEAMVVVLHLRIGIIHDNYYVGYKRIAKTHGALLIPDFMSGILGDTTMTQDGIHPTAEGHELIAQRVLEKLVPLLETSDRIRAGKR